MKKAFLCLNLVLAALIFTLSSCVILEKSSSKGNNGSEQGLKKGWTKNPNNPHNPNTTKTKKKN